MDAVARSRQRDAGLSALLDRRQSHRGAGPSHSDDDEVRECLVAICPLPKHPAAMPLRERAGLGTACLQLHKLGTEDIESCSRAHRAGLA